MSDRSFLTQYACHIIGHDWIYYRSRGERYCVRCDGWEDYEVEETHDDRGARKGQFRYSIDSDNSLRIEQYQCTGWGNGSEEWRWFPIGDFPIEADGMRELRDDIDARLDDEGGYPRERT